MLQCLPRQRRIRICQFCNPLDMVDPVDELGYSGSGNVPIVIFEFIQIYQSDGNVPVFAFGRIG